MRGLVRARVVEMPAVCWGGCEMARGQGCVGPGSDDQLMMMFLGIVGHRGWV